MAKTYNGRFDLPKEPGKGTGWLVAGILLIIVGSIPGIVLGGLSIAKFVKCRKENDMYNRFLQFCTVIGMNSCVTVKELAKAGGRTMSDTRRDLQTMIHKGYFGDKVRLDAATDSLLLMDLDNEKEVANWRDAAIEVMHSLYNSISGKRHKVETVKTEMPKSPVGTSEAVMQKETPVENEKPAEPVREKKKDHMNELERILSELFQLNQKIEDEAVSRRIDRIGELTGSIYRVVIEKPEREGEVRKFMNYYLPATLKLLNSYDMMENQSYQGENIIASRKKIESVLDMLIEAYEKQLDKLFQNDALDIATDIDVLETMMAGDGLTSKGQMPLSM